MNSNILKNLPMELVNHILSFRPTHPTAQIMKPYINKVIENTDKFGDLFLIYVYDEYYMMFDRWRDIQKREWYMKDYIKYDGVNECIQCYTCNRKLHSAPYGCNKYCLKCHKNIYKHLI